MLKNGWNNNPKLLLLFQGRMMKAGSMMISYQPLGDLPNFFRSIISNQAQTGRVIQLIDSFYLFTYLCAFAVWKLDRKQSKKVVFNLYWYIYDDFRQFSGIIFRFIQTEKFNQFLRLDRCNVLTLKLTSLTHLYFLYS